VRVSMVMTLLVLNGPKEGKFSTVRANSILQEEYRSVEVQE
jgi:hypothetical protein